MQAVQAALDGPRSEPSILSAAMNAGRFPFLAHSTETSPMTVSRGLLS